MTIESRALEDRVALVTGAGRGIGRSIALKLARQGARLVVNDLDEAPLREVVSLIEAQGGQATMVAGSVTDALFPDRFIKGAVEVFGRIDILVNNAGYIWNSRIDKTTDEQWNAMLDVHLGAPFRIVRRLVQWWRSQPVSDSPQVNRRIINVSSVSGTHGAVGQIGYSAAKAGLIGLTLSLARELGPEGVNTNAVAFGYIDTRLTQEIKGETAIEVEGQMRRVGLPRAAIDELCRRVPLRRVGTPDEAAGGVVLLCLPEADYINGQVLEIDGGLSI